MNTEPEADRGPRAGSPRGVVVATGSLFATGALVTHQTRWLPLPVLYLSTHYDASFQPNRAGFDLILLYRSRPLASISVVYFGDVYERAVVVFEGTACTVPGQRFDLVPLDNWLRNKGCFGGG
jgi:hypothetical protein